MRKTVVLPDKRKLSYFDVGDEKGKVILYFHGVPSAADEWQAWGDEEKLKLLGIRLIAIDRPGVGLSSFQPNRRISGWAKDMLYFADILGIDKFSVLGYSGGGPYAAVCAALIPERLSAAGIVSGIVSFENEDLLEGINPNNVRFLKLSIQKPLLFRFIYWQIGLLAKLAPEQYLKQALETFGEADAKAFGTPKVYQAILSSKGSAKGQQLDTKIILSPWDFDLKDITIPVHIWYGGQDHNASPAMGRYLGDTIKNNKMNYHPGEGHISLFIKNAEDILKRMAEPD